MLRPDQVIGYAQARGQLRRSDFPQLVDGLNVGGRIIVGGGPENSRRLQQFIGMQNRLGGVVSVNEFNQKTLEVDVTYTFDVMAIAQMLMISKNEVFHATIDQILNLLQDACVKDGLPIEAGLQLLREKADEVGHL